MEKGQIELRCEDLGIEEIFWSYIRLQRRVDDLEGVLGQVLQTLAEGETREQRLAAIEQADAIETIAVHRRLAS